jgi:hypothetical protein
VLEWSDLWKDELCVMRVDGLVSNSIYVHYMYLAIYCNRHSEVSIALRYLNQNNGFSVGMSVRLLKIPKMDVSEQQKRLCLR